VNRYKLTLEYDGTHLVGWQRQPGQASVQSLVEDALKRLGEPEDIFVQGAGRTDAGVHATGQVAHVDLVRPWDPYRLRAALNGELRAHPVSIIDATLAEPDFHARFNAIARHYEYRVIVRASPLVLDKNRAWRITPPFDAKAVMEAANLLIGTHDFSSFRASHCQASSPIKTLDVLRVHRTQTTPEEELLVFEVQARSFLHHQVRNIVGSLQCVGKGKWRVADFKSALEARDRKRGGPTAPASGLILTNVIYP
jgi:tRNA pseudouridine38-40 synthase